MRKTLSVCLLAVLALSGRTIAAPEGKGAALGSNVTVTSANLSINGTSTMHPYLQLKADPNGRQPAMLARKVISGSVERRLDEVRSEIETRSRQASANVPETNGSPFGR